MSLKQWLSLSDYSNKYDVSISTLRRRIKSGKAEYTFEDGKYLLKDLNLSEHTPNTQLKNHHQPDSAPSYAPPQESKEEAEISVKQIEQELVSDAPSSNLDEKGPFWVTVNAMLNELKKAYSLILQEKEEQILQLKDDHTDLRTLVKVLEEENARLKKQMAEPASLDRWLEQNESLEI